MYFTWATTFVPPPPLNYNITRTTGNTYTSVFPGSSPFPGPWNGTGFNITEQTISAALSLTGTTFQFQGSAVTGMKVGLDGYMTFNTAFGSNLGAANLGGSSGGVANITKVLAPFWGNLGCWSHSSCAPSPRRQSLIITTGRAVEGWRRIFRITCD